jgi:hypothetical protein
MPSLQGTDPPFASGAPALRALEPALPLVRPARRQRQPAILELDNLFDGRCADNPTALLMPDVTIAAFECLRGR